MNKMISVLRSCVLLRLFGASVQAQSVLGIWQGIFPGGVAEHLVLTLSKGESGDLSSSLYTVDHAQGYELGINTV
jgi:hypothetical protein